MRTTTSRTVAAALAALALSSGLAACASDTGTTITGPAQADPHDTPTPTNGPTVAPGSAAAQPTTASSAGVSTSAGAATSAVASPSPASAAVSTAPAGTAAAPGIPAITSNPTDLTKEPVAAAGTGSVGAGVVVRDLVVGTGTAAVSTDTVSVRYTGSLYADGTVFDASWKNGVAPASFPLNMVVPGFELGIEGMKPGGRREIVIPSILGYGAQDNGPIPANSDLVFIVDLVSATPGN